MIEITINDFINTLIEAISSSPTSFITIVAGIIFLIAMLISLRKNKKIGKSLFIIGWLFVILFIIFRYSDNLTTLLDNFVNNVFMQIFFPNLATYVIIVAITNFIFLFTILKGNSKMSNKIINSIFFIVIMLLLIITLDVIFKNEINIYEELTVYSNETLLILIEATTIFFILWLIILGSKAIVTKLIKKSDKKVEEEYAKKEEMVNEQNKLSPTNTMPEASNNSLNITEPINDDMSPRSPETIENINSTSNIDQTIPELEPNIEKQENIDKKEESINEPQAVPPTNIMPEASNNSLNITEPINDDMSPRSPETLENINSTSNIDQTIPELEPNIEKQENNDNIEVLKL